MSATVILKNADEIKGFLARVGRFANICKSSDEKTEDVYKRIGLSVINAGHFSAAVFVRTSLYGIVWVWLSIRHRGYSRF